MASMTRWNPIREMITLREAMDQVFNDQLQRNRSDYRQNNNYAWQLPLDAYATEDAIVLIADMPGVKPEELEVTLEGDTLSIRGEIKPRAEGKNFILHERVTGNFERVITINTPIDNGKVEASFEDGVLTLTLPKAEAVKPKQIKINPVKNA